MIKQTPAAGLINTARTFISQRRTRINTTIKRQIGQDTADALHLADIASDYPGAARLLKAAAAHIDRRKGVKIIHV